MSLLNDIMSDTTAPAGPTATDLAEISALAMEQLAYQEQIDLLNAQLSELNEKLRQVSEQTLPAAMEAVGMKAFTLANGGKIDVKDDVACSIKAGHNEAAAAWLDGKGLGDVVKDEIKINLGRGESRQAKLFMELASKLDVPASEQLSVHPGTLKALVKEQLKQGVEFPDNLFSVYPYRKAVIKLPK